MKGRDLLIGVAGGAVLFAVLTSHHPAKAPVQPVSLSSTASAQPAHVAPGDGRPLLYWLFGTIALIALILSIAALITARRRRSSPPDSGLDQTRMARARLEATADHEHAAGWSAEIGELREQARRSQALTEQASAANRAAAEGTTELVRRAAGRVLRTTGEGGAQAPGGYREAGRDDRRSRFAAEGDSGRVGGLATAVAG